MAGMERVPMRGEGWALLAAVAAWNILQNNVDRPTYGWLNAAGSCVVLVAGRALGLGREDLGLGRGAFRRGWVAGRPVALVVAAGTAGAISVPAARRLFRDERVERAGAGEFAREVLFRIPVGTALFEELVFRGLLFGRGARRSGEARATLTNAGAFGVWHILPTLRTLAVYRAGSLRSTRAGSAGAVTAAVVITSVAGVGFSLLRRRTRSLVAPVVVHAVINVGGYVAAWKAAPER